jgi:hypothetical protein
MQQMGQLYLPVHAAGNNYESTPNQLFTVFNSKLHMQEASVCKHPPLCLEPTVCQVEEEGNPGKQLIPPHTNTCVKRVHSSPPSPADKAGGFKIAKWAWTVAC